MSIRKVKIYNNKSIDVEKKVDSVLAAARIFARSYGLKPFKIIVIEDNTVKSKLFPGKDGAKKIDDSLPLIVFAIKPVITNEHINDFISDIKDSKKITGHSLNNYRRHIQDMIENNRGNWASKRLI